MLSFCARSSGPTIYSFFSSSHLTLLSRLTLLNSHYLTLSVSPLTKQQTPHQVSDYNNNFFMGNVEMVCGFVLVCREIQSIKFDCFDFLTVYC